MRKKGFPELPWLPCHPGLQAHTPTPSPLLPSPAPRQSTHPDARDFCGHTHHMHVTPKPALPERLRKASQATPELVVGVDPSQDSGQKPGSPDQQDGGPGPSQDRPDRVILQGRRGPRGLPESQGKGQGLRGEAGSGRVRGGQGVKGAPEDERKERQRGDTGKGAERVSTVGESFTLQTGSTGNLGERPGLSYAETTPEFWGVPSAPQIRAFLTPSAWNRL